MIKASQDRLLVIVESQTGERRVGSLFVASTADNNAVTKGVVASVGPWIEVADGVKEGDAVWFNRFTAAEIDQSHAGKLYSIKDSEVLAYERTEPK